MSKLLIYALVFLLAVGADILAVIWNHARERGKAWQVGLSSVFIGVINWSPVVLLVISQDLIIVALDLAGSGVGGWVGTRWFYGKESTSEE